MCVCICIDWEWVFIGMSLYPKEELRAFLYSLRTNIIWTFSVQSLALMSSTIGITIVLGISQQNDEWLFSYGKVMSNPGGKRLGEIQFSCHL